MRLEIVKYWSWTQWQKDGDGSNWASLEEEQLEQAGKAPLTSWCFRALGREKAQSNLKKGLVGCAVPRRMSFPAP